MSTCAEIRQQCGSDVHELIDELQLGWLFESDEKPQEADKTLAWEVFVELRTRITTQELHFLDGDESTALTSVYNLFQPTGCDPLMAQKSR